MLDKSKQPPNPAPEWISEYSWDDITELATSLPALFDGIVSFKFLIYPQIRQCHLLASLTGTNLLHEPYEGIKFATRNRKMGDVVQNI